MTDIYLDTANLDEIEEMSKWGIFYGITTNQAIFLKEKGVNFQKHVKEILDYNLPTSIEGPNNYEDLIVFAEKYKKTFPHKDLIIKVPMMGNGDGIRAIKTLKRKNIKTNATACITLNQVFLAASAGATYVSLFYNRMIDWHKETYGNKNTNMGKQYALDTIRHSMSLIEHLDTQLIIGSIRKPEDIEDILKSKPDIITIPTKILKQMPFNEKTESTLKEFEEAWDEFNA